MMEPYLMSRREWQNETEKYKSQGSSISRFTKSSASQSIAKIKALSYLYFGVSEWLHNKALDGDKEALSLLELGYDSYDYMLLKAKEMGLIDLPVQWVFKELSADEHRNVLNQYNAKWFDWSTGDAVIILTENNEKIQLWKDCVEIEKINRNPISI